MRYLPDGAEMANIDRYNIVEEGIPSLALIERAAKALALRAEALCPKDAGVLAVCGPGNNGADGLAAARMLKMCGYDVSVILAGDREKASDENRIQLESAGELSIPAEIIGGNDYPDENFGLVIDALFGVGLKRPLEGDLLAAAEYINRIGKSGAFVLAADVPSGVDSGSGRVYGCVVRADETVAFGYEKLGTALYPGAEYAGEVTVADTGLKEPAYLKAEAYAGDLVRAYEKGECGKLPERRRDGNKGTFGRVLIVAGSAGMCGAAYLSAKSAYSCGAGLVQIYTVKENAPVLHALLPEAIISFRGDEENEISESDIEKLCLRADALVIGPGLGTGEAAKRLVGIFLRNISKTDIPSVIDADALNIIAEQRELLKYLGENTAVTPHMGEMSRLTGEDVSALRKDFPGAAKKFREETGAVCVLKDARTAVASEKGLYLNLSGNDGMATGGSGDVLSGIIGGLLAGGLRPADAAETGTYLHGLAGDAAAKEKGRRAMLAGDIAYHIGDILKEWDDDK